MGVSPSSEFIHPGEKLSFSHHQYHSVKGITNFNDDCWVETLAGLCAHALHADQQPLLMVAISATHWTCKWADMSRSLDERKVSDSTLN